MSGQKKRQHFVADLLVTHAAVFVFAVRLGWLPSSGRQDVTLTTEHPTGFFVLDGLLTGEWEEKESGRKRRYYHITKKGRAALQEKVQSWTDLCQGVNRILEKSEGQA